MIQTIYVTQVLQNKYNVSIYVKILFKKNRSHWSCEDQLYGLVTTSCIYEFSTIRSHNKLHIRIQYNTFSSNVELSVFPTISRIRERISSGKRAWAQETDALDRRMAANNLSKKNCVRMQHWWNLATILIPTISGCKIFFYRQQHKSK